MCVYAIYTERSLGTYVSTYACAHVWTSACARSVHSSVRVGARMCMSARACARERRERRRNPSARPPNVCHYAHIYVGTSTCDRMYMHMYVRACRSHASVCACARVFARAAGAATQPEVATSSSVSLCTYMWVCRRVSPYVYVREHI